MQEILASLKSLPPSTLKAAAEKVGIKGGRPWSAFTPDELYLLWNAAQPPVTLNPRYVEMGADAFECWLFPEESDPPCTDPVVHFGLPETARGG
jgi:hypothetical protein